MEMASSTIIDLRSFLRQRGLYPSVSGSVERSNFSRYGPSDLASPDRSWIFSHGYRGEYCPRNFYLSCYVLDNGDSCSQISSDVNQVVRLLFPGILVLVLLQMVTDYFNGCAHARDLGIAAQIKFMGETPLVFSDLWFGIYRLPPKKHKIVS
jgi:hypothetical protein